MPADDHGPMIADADRLIWLVRGMAASEFTRRFRDGLPAAELMGVITALPSDRLNELTDRARQAGADSHDVSHTRKQDHDLALAGAIREARKRAGMSQGQLAEALGIRQSSVSQWERGSTAPTGRRLRVLVREFPELAEALKAGA